ncbi:polysaccharide deacetylase family protein [Microbacterium sp. X-17]|uniref:polysaccharide deacetylase family protein n=1 Tax=Microbacterium sp. X-17 TaxID=3144404 RepID=UPI0031F55FC7
MRCGPLRRLAAASLGLVAVALVLAGCATPADATWTPPAWSLPAAVRVTAPAPLDPASVANLTGQRIRNDAVGIAARWSLLPGSQALNGRLAGLVKDAVTARATATKTRYTPAVFPTSAGLGDRGCVRGSTLRPAAEVLTDPALGPAGPSGTAVTCDIVTAIGPFLGERMRVVTGDPAHVASDASTLLYTNVATGEVTLAAQLWTAAAPAELWDDVVDAMRRDAGSLSLATIAPPDQAGAAAIRAALASTVAAPDGSLVITLPPGFTAPELVALGLPPTTESTSIAVGPSASGPLTTPFARQLVEAAGQAFAAPAAVPAGAESVDCTLVPCVAMTYDDGPSDLSSAILDAAAKHHASVTFFWMGEKAAQYAGTIKRAVAEGHLVENHTWNHPHLTTLSPAAVTKQIKDTQAALATAAGVTPKAFRPPYGQYNPGVLAAAGLPAILWDYDTLDWQGPADSVLIDRAVNGPSVGSIVLQHDIQAVTGRVVGTVYDGLADRGFTLVNVQQLLGGKLPASGIVKSGR